MDEDSCTKNIVTQLEAFASSKGLLFFSDVSKITRKNNKYTKYFLSRPDTVDYLIKSQDYSRLLYIATNPNPPDLSESMSGITLNVESKKKKRIFPRIQLDNCLLAWRKRWGTFFVKHKIKRHVSRVWLCLESTEDSVEVYKAVVEFGKITTVYKGGTPLKVSDAFNRLMYQFLPDLTVYFTMHKVR